MISNSETMQDLTLISDYDFAKVMMNEATGQKALYASKQFQPGDLICLFNAGTTSSFPTYLTVQVGENEHITLEPEFLQYTNHSCDPNAFFDTTTMEFVCLKSIEPGDEFSFFYPSTEWEMAQPFSCYCGSPDCLQMITGASQIPGEILIRYKVTDFIRSKKYI